MLPIVKGCQAIIVNSVTEHLGRFVIVGNYVGEIEGGENKNNWETDIKHKKGYSVLADESQLMRIDGYKEEAKEKADDVKVN